MHGWLLHVTCHRHFCSGLSSVWGGGQEGLLWQLINHLGRIIILHWELIRPLLSLELLLLLLLLLLVLLIFRSGRGTIVQTSGRVRNRSTGS